jgi:hypothetical protein
MDRAPKNTQEILRHAIPKLVNADLGEVKEGSGVDDGDNEEDARVTVQLPLFDIAQAFVHFSYGATGRKRLV